MVYFPNFALNGMSIALSNFQFPVESTSAVLVLMIFPTGPLISTMTVEPDNAVPNVFNLSPLNTIWLIPSIVIFSFSDISIRFCSFPNLKLTIFSSF